MFVLIGTCMVQAARVPDQTRHRNHGKRLLAVAAPQSQPRHTCLAVAAVAVPPRWPLLLPRIVPVCPGTSIRPPGSRNQRPGELPGPGTFARVTSQNQTGQPRCLHLDADRSHSPRLTLAGTATKACDVRQCRSLAAHVQNSQHTKCLHSIPCSRGCLVRRRFRLDSRVCEWFAGGLCCRPRRLPACRFKLRRGSRL